MTVQTYGRIIVSERHLPLGRKTFSPLQSGAGVAGGEKYIVKGIYFKFALDVWRGSHWLYGQVESRHGLAGYSATRSYLTFQPKLQDMS